MNLSPPSASPENAVYVALAYRWGALNDHHYLVAAGADFDQLCQTASDEADFRGGKYGVAVLEASSQSEASTGACRAYFCSMAREDAPYTNHRATLFERVGQKAVLALERGYAHSAPDSEGVSVEVPVGFPDWFKEDYLRIARQQRVIELFEGHHKARRALETVKGYAWHGIRPRKVKELWERLKSGEFEPLSEVFSMDGGILTRAYHKGMRTVHAHWLWDSLDGDPFGIDEHGPIAEPLA